MQTSFVHSPLSVLLPSFTLFARAPHFIPPVPSSFFVDFSRWHCNSGATLKTIKSMNFAIFHDVTGPTAQQLLLCNVPNFKLSQIYSSFNVTVGGQIHAEISHIVAIPQVRRSRTVLSHMMLGHVSVCRLRLRICDITKGCRPGPSSFLTEIMWVSWTSFLFTFRLYPGCLLCRPLGWVDGT